MNNFILVSSKYEQCNIKSHDIINIHLPKYCNTVYVNSNEAINFIINNNNKNNNIILYHHFYVQSVNEHDFHVDIIKFLHSFENILSNIVIFAFDWWRESSFRERPRREHTELIFKAKNYKVIVNSQNLEQLNNFHNINYDEYKDNIIFNKFWSCYNLSNLEFNYAPINKLLLSGDTCGRYPERVYLRKILSICNLIDGLPRTINQDSKNNNYNKNLNKYIACFSSSVYVYNFSTNKLENTNLILLKTYEILAAGSLLVMPISEKEYVKEIGLIDNLNCCFINFNENEQDVIEQINNILNLENINEIRKNGQKLAIEQLNSSNKFDELKKFLIKI